jgi:hypothetical protein
LPNYGEVCRFDGHIRARPHRDAQVGLRQGRRVIHAVTSHGNRGAAGLQFTHGFDLALRQHRCEHILRSDADGGCHLRGHCRVVAGQQHRPEAQLLQPRNRGRRARLDGVPERDNSRRPPVHGNPDGSSPGLFGGP